MFVGHYAVSFWFKARDPSLPLWVLVIAVQLVDIVWAGLVLLGVERVAIVPGITAASPLDLQYVPYTHSLTAVGGWSLLAMWLWFRLDRNGPGRTRRAVLVGSAVFSHWLGDLLVHRPDLPIYDNRHKVGLGLWDYAAASFMLETGLLALTIWFWYRSSQRQADRRAMLAAIDAGLLRRSLVLARRP